MKFLAVSLAAAVALAAPIEAETPLYPQINETDHATPEIAGFFDAFFTAKSRHDVDATMAFFSPDLLTYTDAILGWPLDGFDAVKGTFDSYMPNWGEGRSYPVRIIGGPDSAVVAFVDTPELFGGELRLLGALDLKNGKIIRWVDYWDSAAFPDDTYAALRTPADAFPTDFKEAGVPAGNAAAEIVEVATAVQEAFASGDLAELEPLLTYDVVYEDMALRSQILGREGLLAYLGRILPRAPFGQGAELIHIVGGVAGGRFEWRATTSETRGLTAIELDPEGQITRITSTYDSRLLPEGVQASLVLLSLEPE